MNISEVMEHYRDLTPKVKRRALRRVLEELEDNEDLDPVAEDSLIYDMLAQASYFENDDFFGTEGLRV